MRGEIQPTQSWIEHQKKKNSNALSALCHTSATYCFVVARNSMAMCLIVVLLEILIG